MSWEGLRRALAAPFARRRALRALDYGKGDLGIDWPVYILWRRGLAGRGRASSRRKHAIELREPHEPREAARTVLHELYHLAQFHKWGDLDPRQRKEVLELVKSLAGKHTVVLSTHILSEVKAICQKVLIIHRGKIVANDSMAAITGGKETGLEDKFIQLTAE